MDFVGQANGLRKACAFMHKPHFTLVLQRVIKRDERLDTAEINQDQKQISHGGAANTAKIKIKSLFSADYADIADGKDQDQKRNAKTAKKALRNAKVFIFS